MRPIPQKRYDQTLAFIQSVVPAKSRVLDLGIENRFSGIMKNNGFTVFNTNGEDLDIRPEVVKSFDVEVVTAIEILEHLISPLQVLTSLPAKKLIATIPLRLWFASAYKSKTDPWDRHYHEFEDWQFDWLLEKAGWEIINRKKWVSPSNKIGFRPFLRNITPRYYAVYAERI
jgi:hypothetical protein